jgi:hypothetical protein
MHSTNRQRKKQVRLCSCWRNGCSAAMGGYGSVSRILKPGTKVDARHLIHYLEFQVPSGGQWYVGWPADVERERLILHLVRFR